MPPRSLAEPRSAATKLRILDAAEREFAARGFAGARLREVADGAGVQTALIHHYFADKQGLYRAVLDRGLLPTSTDSWGLLGSRSDLEGLLEGFVDLLLRFYAAHQNLLAILRHEAVSGSTILADVHRERALPVIAAVAQIVEAKQRAGEIRAELRAEEIILAALSLVICPFAEAGILQTLVAGAVPADDAALERRKQVIVGLLLRGIRP